MQILRILGHVIKYAKKRKHKACQTADASLIFVPKITTIVFGCRIEINEPNIKVKEDNFGM